MLMSFLADIGTGRRRLYTQRVGMIIFCFIEQNYVSHMTAEAFSDRYTRARLAAAQKFERYHTVLIRQESVTRSAHITDSQKV